jgi:hypothetical protein
MVQDISGRSGFTGAFPDRGEQVVGSSSPPRGRWMGLLRGMNLRFACESVKSGRRISAAVQSGQDVYSGVKHRSHFLLLPPSSFCLVPLGKEQLVGPAQFSKN